MRCRANVITVLLLLATLDAIAQSETEPVSPPPVVTPTVAPEDPVPSSFDSFEAPCAQFITAADYDYLFRPWYTRVDALFLQRSNPAGGQTVVQTSSASAPVIGTGDFGYAMVAGPRLLIGKQIDAFSALESSYFGTHYWKSAVTAIDPNNLDLPGAVGLAAADFGQADVMTVTYRSQLHNAEVNYVTLGEGVSFLAGFRYVNWQERFSINSQDDAHNSVYDLHTNNNLIGGQIGARALRPGFHVDWELIGKAGLFGNSANQQQRLTDNNNSVVLRDVATGGSAFSFVGDLNLNAVRRINRVWQLRVGYNVMLITGLALAPNQLDFTNAPGSGARLDRADSVFLHGVNVGLDARW